MSTSRSHTVRRIVVVGAGHATATFVGLLRSGGFDGQIQVLGEESIHPYHRPPLSKGFAHEDPLEDWLRHPDFYSEHAINLGLGQRVTSVDRAARRVATQSGQVYDYDCLVLATGARPRSLSVPGSDLDGVVGLRTVADAQHLRLWLEQRRQVVIVGAGYVGLEVAAVFRSHRLPVTVLERESRVLARVASEQFSRIITEHHAAAGTDIRTGAEVARVVGDEEGRVRGVVLPDGEESSCTAVLVGVGAIPNDELAATCGIECAASGGILVDRHGRTSDPAVLAIGDVTVRPVPGVQVPRRLESIPSATEQARQAAAHILGSQAPSDEAPWFWSDQFDLKLKIAGIIRPDARTTLRGNPSSGRFALYHHVDDVVTAVECSNAPQEFMAGRKWVGSRTIIDPVKLADPDVPLREAVA